MGSTMKTLQTASLVLISTVTMNLMTISTASAEIFKCTHKSGKVYYNDKPCPTSQKEKKLQAVKDPEGGYIAPAVVAAAKEKVKKKEKDLFGTPQYKGKETAKTHTARLAEEKKMEAREASVIEKQQQLLEESGAEEPRASSGEKNEGATGKSDKPQ